ncbi:MAG TPA: glycosyltransferase [Steroidobacteraceae bacterium]|nr:glycosyltransferase [Steroidobacteraceae bacterium]
MSATNTAVPDVSLVICTRNRGAQLRRCLRRLSELQCIRPWELIVVDNGSTDDTAQILHQFQRAFDGTALIVREATPGLARARNRGWEASRGSVVAFTDDDCYPDAQFLTCILQHFDADPGIGYLGGRILLFDQQDYRVTLLEYPEPIDLKSGYIIATGTIQGANMSLRRSVLEAVGGFDESLGAGTPFPSEDIDIAARASALGWRGAYRPDVVVYHHHGRRTAAEANQLMRSYDRGRGAYYAKCLLNARIRRSALKHWLRMIPRQSLQQTARELAAGFVFTLHHYSRRRATASATGRLAT